MIHYPKRVFNHKEFLEMFVIKLLIGVTTHHTFLDEILNKKIDSSKILSKIILFFLSRIESRNKYFFKIHLAELIFLLVRCLTKYVISEILVSIVYTKSLIFTKKIELTNSFCFLLFLLFYSQAHIMFHFIALFL